jgi:cytochrome c oxidase assembly protein subunit 15
MPRPNRNVHHFAVFTAGCTFFLLIAGALVTSNDAGLSVPDWPLSYGSLTPPMVGGIFYEHGHRVIAACVGLLSIVLAVWLWQVERRSWVRWLGVAAVGAVVAQGILGGLTVLFFLPPAVSSAHAALAQLFFCTILSIALFTSAWWERSGTLAVDSGSPGIHTLAVVTGSAVFIQLLLGAAFRHKGFGIIPHLAWAAVVTVLIFVLARTLRRRFADVPLLRHASRLLLALIGIQLLLGGAAWWSRLYAADFPQPIPIMVSLTVIHTVTGAVVLGSVVLLTLACYRMVLPREAESPLAMTTTAAGSDRA